MSTASTTAKESAVSQNTDSPDSQRLAQKRILEASLFGDEEEDSPPAKKTKPDEAKDSAQMKDKAKTEKKHDGAELKASKQSLEVNGNSRRSSSKTPEPMSSKHLDDSGKSSKYSHSKQSTESRNHHSHSKPHHRSSHNSASAAAAKQTTPPLSDGKSAAVPASSSKKDETPLIPDAAEKRTVSPLRLSKLPLPSSSAAAATQNHSSAHYVDMKNLFGDDDDDDDDDVEVTDAAAAAAAVAVGVQKDDSQHKVDNVRAAEKTKRQSLHGHKKTPEKPHSSKAHTPPTAKGRSDKADVHLTKSTGSLSSSRGLQKRSRQHSESAVDKRSRDAAKSSGKPATRPDSAAPAVTRSKPVSSGSAARSSKVSQAEKRGAEESGGCEVDLSLSDTSDSSSEANDVDVCDSGQPEKPPSSSSENGCHDDAAAAQFPSLSREAKAANGEYVTVLLDLQKQMMSIADDDTLEKLTTMVEETGKYSVTTETFDFDLCQLDIRTVNKLKRFLATVAC